MRNLRLYIMWAVIILLVWSVDGTSLAKETGQTPRPEVEEKLQLYKKFEAIYGIPWNYLAAIDQYERSIKKKKQSQEQQDNPEIKRLTAITISPDLWCGFFNPDSLDQELTSISFFQGIGKDGSGDEKADLNNDYDVLTTIIDFLSDYGFQHDDFKIGLWNYYKRDAAVRTIMGFSKIYDKYQTIDLDYHAFPIPKRYSYSYRSTWGSPRGWGGRRIHEGVDIFAGYSTPVLSTGYGIVEVKGWNRYGGWRFGIRDINGIYHYFAHLSSFSKGLKEGDIVEPGQVIGYVGSSGYGKPGTSGKFPPHLHYGMYRDTGNTEWAFDPYPSLRRWEHQKKQPRPEKNETKK
ncbi:M23 family metallopeptidase [Brevibacillus daliensis]|uniref:M23 family metallopeptidase n=1 Tax=Brevibacillus daliensis TaxID=2892995 RepID=UPI0027155A0F|nr:M23 family metallopeptidase [Brevibacillus daliensis]